MTNLSRKEKEYAEFLAYEKYHQRFCDDESEDIFFENGIEIVPIIPKDTSSYASVVMTSGQFLLFKSREAFKNYREFIKDEEFQYVPHYKIEQEDMDVSDSEDSSEETKHSHTKSNKKKRSKLLDAADMKKWIVRHPPVREELVELYYRRFRTDNKANKLGKIAFDNRVYERGFRKREKTDNEYCWVRKADDDSCSDDDSDHSDSDSNTSDSNNDNDEESHTDEDSD